MTEFLASIQDTIALLSTLDWAIIALLFVFLAVGFGRGITKELVNIAILILAIIMAVVFYQMLGVSSAVTWLMLSEQSHFAIAFGAVFLGVLALKRGIYKLTRLSSNISNPCALNTFFTQGIFLILAVALSGHYLDFIAKLGIMEIVITNVPIRTGLSFVVIFLITLWLYSFLARILNLSINPDKPCFLGFFFKGILAKLQTLNDQLHHSNIGMRQHFFGALAGLIKGAVVIITLVLVLQSIDGVALKYPWMELGDQTDVILELIMRAKITLAPYVLFLK